MHGYLNLLVAAPAATHLPPELPDQLRVVVVGLDALGVAAGDAGGTLDQVRPQGTCQGGGARSLQC